jgi:integrase
MGIFTRDDSPYWWLYLEATKAREKTQIVIGTTTAQRRESRAVALDLYHARMLAFAREAQELPEPAAPPAPLPTFDAFADWYDTHQISRHAGAERERQILRRLRVVFGPLTLDQITKAVVIEWRTARRTTGTTVDRFGLTSGAPATWRKIHAMLRIEGPMALADIRARFPVSTRDVCSTILSDSAKPYFRRVRRGVWAATGRPAEFLQRYAPPVASTVNREVDFLQQILAAAVEAGHLTQSPLYGLANLDIVKPIRRTMSEAEERAICAHLAPDDYAIVLVGLDTLARMIDILDLEWADVHDRSLDIRDHKNGNSHTVPLSSRVRAALAQLPRDTRYCFPRRRVGNTQTARRKTVADALKRACLAAGVPYGRAARGITFHWATRRTGATRMIQRGGEKAIAVVQKIGNWKDAGVLIGIYQETITAEMEAAVESVGAQMPASIGTKKGKVIPVSFPQKRRNR